MIEYIKRYCFAWKICKRYKIKLYMHYNNEIKARYHFKGAIEISLGNHYFYESFLHELSHHYDYTKSKGFSSKSHHNRATRGTTWVRLRSNSPRFKDINMNTLLYQEARANRYAMIMLKKLGKGNENSHWGLYQFMRSYITQIDSSGLQVKLKLADIDYKINNYILNK